MADAMAFRDHGGGDQSVFAWAIVAIRRLSRLVAGGLAVVEPAFGAARDLCLGPLGAPFDRAGILTGFAFFAAFLRQNLLAL